MHRNGCYARRSFNIKARSASASSTSMVNSFHQIQFHPNIIRYFHKTVQSAAEYLPTCLAASLFSLQPACQTGTPSALNHLLLLNISPAMVQFKPKGPLRSDFRRIKLRPPRHVTENPWINASFWFDIWTVKRAGLRLK
jgi:hypothetical protein